MRRALAAFVLCGALCAVGVDADKGQLRARIETQIAFVVATERLSPDFHIAGDSHQHLLPVYIAAVKRKGIPVYLVPLYRDTGALMGLTSCPTVFGGRRCVVLVDNRSTPNMQLGTLLHELAHLEQPRGFTRMGQSEVWAETVAYLVAQELGLDSTAASMTYLWMLPENTRFQVLTDYERPLLAVVQRLAEIGKQGKAV